MCRGHPSLAWASDLARMMQISLIVFAVTTAALSMGYFELYYVLVALTSRCRRNGADCGERADGRNTQGAPCARARACLAAGRATMAGRSLHLPGSPGGRQPRPQYVRNPGSCSTIPPQPCSLPCMPSLATVGC